MTWEAVPDSDTLVARFGDGYLIQSWTLSESLAMVYVPDALSHLHPPSATAVTALALIHSEVNGPRPYSANERLQHIASILQTASAARLIEGEHS